ncbi:MAG: hypothetical protein PHX27_00055 [Candidatus ainarchaeum sp.]|nr:hypothetical protein [Candidatus ainarchaeum sp.]
MGLIKILKNLFNKKTNINTNKINSEETQIYTENKETIQKTIISVWDVINCTEHTQAYHLVNVIPFDEWIDMNEIKRRIWDFFQIEYKNDRSLYPYLKTMVDLGIIETGNIGGKRKWRKKDLLIKIDQEKKLKEEIKQKNKILTNN